jgi:hypothetical protein
LPLRAVKPRRPLLLSGGRVDARDETSMAELMQRVMREDFGWSSNHFLVTRCAHMNRAAREFTRAGISGKLACPA